MKKIVLIVLAVLLFSLVVCSPQIFELIYINNKTENNLYKLCKISNVLKNQELVLKYYPELIFNNENNEIIVANEKDDMLCVYLNAAIEIDDFEEQKNILEKSYLSFSEIESAIIGSTNFINAYYTETNDRQKCYELYELLLDSSSNLTYEFKNGIYSKYIAFIIQNNDYPLLEKIRTERIKFLKNNGIDLWDNEEQSPHIGDGAIVG